MARAHLRDAEAPLPVAHVVSPEGLLKDIPYGAGFCGGIVEHVPGKGPRIGSEARDRKWVLLSELYANEGRSAVYSEYVRFRELAAKGLVNPDSFPADLLPKELLTRRAAAKRAPSELPAFEISRPVEDKPAKGK